MQVLEERLGFNGGQSGVVLLISPVQPLKRFVGFVTECINPCDLERIIPLIFGN